MRERAEQILKIACLALGVLVLVQAVRAVFFGNPLARVRIPDVPALSADTNAPAGTKGTNAATKVTARNATNPPASKPGTAATNAASGLAEKTDTNLQATAHSGTVDTNAVVPAESTNQVTKVAALEEPGNDATNAAAGSGPTNAEAQVVVIPATGAGTTPAPEATLEAAGTNRVAQTNPTNSGTNKLLVSSRKVPGSNRPPVMVSMAKARPGAPRPPELAPDAKARVYRVVDSEILGQVVHPQPMALLGIAGDTAFLRAANGQSGTAKEGESVGDLKLLRIGINRVLVEQDGQEKELTIFSGYGGEKLLSKTNEKSDETDSK